MWKCEELKTLTIDVEKGIYEVNGRDISGSCSEFHLEFENGHWSLKITEDRLYSTNDQFISKG